MEALLPGQQQRPRPGVLRWPSAASRYGPAPPQGGREGGGLDEGELIERSKRADTAAYEELVRGHQDIAFRTAFLITGDAAEAEDAAQEAFVKAYYHLSRFRPGAPFRPWLLTIVANEARNRRAAGRRRLELTARAGEAQVGGDGEPSPESSVLAGERRAQLLTALQRLREEERLAVTCRYFLELSEAEMAATLGCPRGTIKSRLSRALEHLRTLLGGAETETTERGVPHG